MIAHLEHINKFYNGNHVLRDVDLSVDNADRIGLIGVNGCGKSTLLRILTGKEYADEGTVSVTNGMRIGYLEQNTGLDRSSTIYEEMRTAFSSLLEVADRMRELEHAMAAETSHDTEKYHAIAAEYAKQTAYFEANEGYLIDVKIRTVLNGMGFSEELNDRVISTLSGGEKTRLALSKLLLENPDLLILDEPTNHLDFETVMWLEDYLQSYKGALLLVSHDRYFLDKLASSVAEIENGKLTRYKGNYSAFVVQKEMAVERQMKEYEAQQEEIAKLQDYVDRNLARASTAKSAKSRINTLERMEIIEKPTAPPKASKIQFTYEIDPPKDLLTVENIDIIAGKGSDSKLLVENCSFEVKRGDKLAVVGGNGIGKSTLLKIIQKLIPHSKGRIEWTKNVKISYFDQENAQLNPSNTVLEELHGRYRGMTEQSLRSVLGSVRLVGENVFKQVGVISGGERAKLCFAIIMLEHANVLVLDEPTNHLDLSAKEALEKALSEYTGTVIFVSHDRYLLNRIATRILEITPNRTEAFECGFEDYIAEKKQRELAERQQQDMLKQEQQKAQAAEKSLKTYRTREQRNADAQRKKRIRELENTIDDLQKQVDALEEEMTTPEVFSDYQLMNEKCMLVADLKTQISDMTDEWLELSE